MTPDEIELIAQYVDGNLAEDRAEELRSLLQESAEARALLRSLATVDFGLQNIAARDDESIGSGPPSALPDNRNGMSTFSSVLLAAAAVVIIGLATGLYFQHTNHLQALSTLANKTDEALPIATIKSMGGVVYWTGDGGKVTSEIGVGSPLAGGTIESSSPSAWIELEFLDGTTVMVSGDSRLTFSDFGQKILHLKKGNVTSKVSPQPPSRPMLVHTRTALLEVLGTEFNVGSELDATSLNVTEGKVRLKRLSDGEVVDVPANQRVVSATGQPLKPHLIPESISQWKSQFQTDPLGVHGRLVPKTDTTEARLRTVPYMHTTPKGEPMALFAAGLQIFGKDGAIVELGPHSMIQVRGYVKNTGSVVFGVTARKSNGDHGGNFMVLNPVLNLDSDGRFECILKASDLRLDPGLIETNESLEQSPVNTIAEAFFCSTADESAGIEITEVKIFDGSQDSQDKVGSKVTAKQLVDAMDTNGDSKISRAEASEDLILYFEDYDVNGDKVIDLLEAYAMAAFVNAQSSLSTSATPSTPSKSSKSASSSDAVAKAKRLIAQIDSDKNGTVSLKEAPAELKPYFSQFDTNGNGEIDANEAEALIPYLGDALKVETAKNKPAQSPEQGKATAKATAKGLMQQMDLNSDGKITKAEAPDQLKASFQYVDANGDGGIDEAEAQSMADYINKNGQQ